MYASASAWYSASVILAAVLVTWGVSTSFGGLPSGVMPLRSELLDMERRAAGAWALDGADKKTGAAEILGRAVRAMLAVRRLRQATCASRETLDRAMIGFGLELLEREIDGRIKAIGKRPINGATPVILV
jgi:hypothetical protein